MVAGRGHIHLMDSLLASAVHDVSAKEKLLEEIDSQGLSPLHHAIEGGHLPMVLLLLRYGAIIDKPIVKSQDSRTPIMLAIDLGRTDIVDALLKRGASVEPKGQQSPPFGMLLRCNGHCSTHT